MSPSICGAVIDTRAIDSRLQQTMHRLPVYLLAPATAIDCSFTHIERRLQFCGADRIGHAPTLRRVPNEWVGWEGRGVGWGGWSRGGGFMERVEGWWGEGEGGTERETGGGGEASGARRT